MAFQNVDNFKRAGAVAEKDDVTVIREAADVGAQLRPRTAQFTWQSGESSALLLQTIYERARNSAIAALQGEVSKDIPEVLPRRR